jgi:hypothetical protein
VSRIAICAVSALSVLSACGGSILDAGSDRLHGPLPIDERNPIILANDGPHDNWDGEFAMVLASRGRINLLAIIVNTAPYYPLIEDNVQGWRDMVKAARASGMRNIPDPTTSIGPILQRPANGDVSVTEPNHSEGARLIIDAAHRLSQPLRPIVVATGGRLTDIADAYLIDPSIADLVVVVASLGQSASDGSGAVMSIPNGEIDPWADEIVLRKFRYVQVNAYYAQQGDIPSARVGELPANPFGAWMTSKLADILSTSVATDQNSIIACAFPDFALNVVRMSEASATPPPAGTSPTLSPNFVGNGWVVNRGNNALATARFWEGLKDPTTYGH